MYLYFLPTLSDSRDIPQGLPEGGRQEVQVPTSDGGIEINEARFQPASSWLEQARAGEIMLYPPQFLLLSIVAEFLDQGTSSSDSDATLTKTTTSVSREEKDERRKRLIEFVHSGNPPWTDKFVSPRNLRMLEDQRVVLALDHPGPELQDSGKRGDFDRVIVVNFGKKGPTNVDVRWRSDVLKEIKETKEPKSSL